MNSEIVKPKYTGTLAVYYDGRKLGGAYYISEHPAIVPLSFKIEGAPSVPVYMLALVNEIASLEYNVERIVTNEPISYKGQFNTESGFQQRAIRLVCEAAGYALCVTNATETMLTIDLAHDTHPRPKTGNGIAIEMALAASIAEQDRGRWGRYVIARNEKKRQDNDGLQRLATDIKEGRLQ